MDMYRKWYKILLIIWQETIQCGPKSKPLSNDQKIVLKRAGGIRFVVKLKYESSTIILFVGIRYSMHDLLSDLNYYASPSNYRYCQLRKLMSALPLASAHLNRLWLLCLILSDALILPVSQRGRWNARVENARVENAGADSRGIATDELSR